MITVHYYIIIIIIGEIEVLTGLNLISQELNSNFSTSGFDEWKSSKVLDKMPTYTSNNFVLRSWGLYEINLVLTRFWCCKNSCKKRPSNLKFFETLIFDIKDLNLILKSFSIPKTFFYQKNAFNVRVPKFTNVSIRKKNCMQWS